MPEYNKSAMNPVTMATIVLNRSSPHPLIPII